MSNRIISVIAALNVACVLSLTAKAVGDLFSFGRFEFEVIDEDVKEVRVTSFTPVGLSPQVCYIPSQVTYGGKTWTVVEIGQNALHDEYSEIFIPNTIREIKSQNITKVSGGLLIIEENDPLTNPTTLRIANGVFAGYDPYFADILFKKTFDIQFSKIYLGRECEIIPPDYYAGENFFVMANQDRLEELVVGKNVKDFSNFLVYNENRYFYHISRVILYCKDPPVFPYTLFIPCQNSTDYSLGARMLTTFYVPIGSLLRYKQMKNPVTGSLTWGSYMIYGFNSYDGDTEALDLNQDGEVNVGDVSEAYSAILENGDYLYYDINGDNEVNVGDVSRLYDGIMNVSSGLYDPERWWE